MQDARRAQLDRHRPAEGGGDARGVIGGPGEFLLDHRYPRRRQQALRFPFRNGAIGQPGGGRSPEWGANRSGRRPGGRIVRGSDVRSVGPAARVLGEAAREAVERRDRADGAGGVLEHGAADRLVLADDVGRSHDREHEQAFRPAGVGAFDGAPHGLDHAVGRRDVGEEGDHRVVPPLLEDDAQVVADEIHLVEGLGRDVDRVARRGIRQGRLQARLRGLAEGGDVEPEADRGIRHLHAHASGDGDEGDARGGGEPAEAGGVGDVEHLVRVARAVDAELAERRLVDRVGAGERCRVGLHRPGSNLGHADLLEDHGLAAGAGRPQRSQQGIPIGDPLGVRHDDRDVVLLRQPAEHLGHRDVDLVAGRHPVADVDVALAREQRQVASVGAALTDERDAARCREAVLERRAEGGEGAELGVVDAKAVGADDAHAGPGRDRAEAVLLAAAVGAHLREAGAEDQGGPHASRRACLHRLHHAGRRHGDDRQVRRFRHVGDAAERRQPLDLGMPRIDGIDPAAVAGGAQVANRAPADARGVARSADHGDGRRAQQGVEGVALGGGGRHRRRTRLPVAAGSVHRLGPAGGSSVREAGRPPREGDRG